MATNSRPSNCAVAILDAVPPSVWFIRREMRRHRAGLSIPQFRALYFINKNPSASLSDVAGHVGSSLSRTSRMIASLQAKELITRKEGKGDRRLMELGITTRGAAVMDSARSATLAKIDAELAALNAGKRSALEKGMALLRELFTHATGAGREPRRES